ncbi:MAG: hypothetical protein NC395_07165 [Prevotella sp.]|nr:hypothetical protein [Prevotella sp.]
MDENEGLAELLVKEVKENRTREILLLLDKCKDLKEAEEKVRALLKD